MHDCKDHKRTIYDTTACCLQRLRAHSVAVTNPPPVIAYALHHRSNDGLQLGAR